MTLTSALTELMKPLIEDNTAPPMPELKKTGFSRKLLGFYRPVGEVPPAEAVINTLANDGYKNIIDYKINEDGIEVYNNALAVEADVIGSMRGINYKFEQVVKGKQDE